MSITTKPSHWPKHIRYLEAPEYHKSVNSQVRSYIEGTQQRINQKARSLVVIRPISITSHPACGQHGLFAAKKIPPKTHILDYVGEVHSDDRPHSDYDLSLYRSLDGANVGIDASMMGNEARFVNDYRGVRLKPNATFVDGRTTSGELRMSVWSSGEIKKGDEILVSYGKGWWGARQAEGIP